MSPSKAAPAVITAVPAGRRGTGEPITTRRTYMIDRQPEPFAPGTSRIWMRNDSFRAPDGGPIYTPTVVVADSIEGLQQDDPHPLSAARGIVYLLALGLVAWAAIAGIAAAIVGLFKLLGWWA